MEPTDLRQGKVHRAWAKKDPVTSYWQGMMDVGDKTTKVGEPQSTLKAAVDLAFEECKTLTKEEILIPNVPT